MTNQNKIALVKQVKRQLNELLSDTGIKTLVKYTSADDTLVVTFRKISKGCVTETTNIGKLSDYTAGPHIAQFICSEAIEAFKPKWTAASLMAELERRDTAYTIWNGNDSSRHRYHFGFAVTTSTTTVSGIYYSVCGDCGLRVSSDKVTLDEVEQEFERHAGEASHGEYTRWRAAGEPKTRQVPVRVTPEYVYDTVDLGNLSDFMRDFVVNRPAIGNMWTYGPSHAERVRNMQQVELDDQGRPTTLMGLPIVWDCDFAPVQTERTSCEQPNNTNF